MNTTKPDPLDHQEGDMDNEPGVMDNGIPAGAWLEYDNAADWCAAHGLLGIYGNALPEGLSSRAKELIDLDLEAFERRVREHAYFRSMTGPRQVIIIKSGEDSHAP